VDRRTEAFGAEDVFHVATPAQRALAVALGYGVTRQLRDPKVNSGEIFAMPKFFKASSILVDSIQA
jgi:hypothetical protein